MDEISFTVPGAYPEMVNHILVHKYYVNQEYPYEISFEEAAKSWYANVYFPIVNEIRKQHLLAAFPGQTEADMYMWIVRKWDEYKRIENKNITAAEAVRRIGRESRRNPFTRLARYIRYYLLRFLKR